PALNFVRTDVTTNVIFTATYPTIASLGTDGRYVVGYTDVGNDPDHVVIIFVAPPPTGPFNAVTPTPSADDGQAELAILPNGSVVFVWQRGAWSGYIFFELAGIDTPVSGGADAGVNETKPDVAALTGGR